MQVVAVFTQVKSSTGLPGSLIGKGAGQQVWWWWGLGRTPVCQCRQVQPGRSPGKMSARHGVMFPGRHTGVCGDWQAGGAQQVSREAV